MTKWFAALAFAAAALAPASAQTTAGWTIEERVLEDGARALVLFRPQGQTRVEYRVRHVLVRSVARVSDGCTSEGSSTEMLTVAERLASARTAITAAMEGGDCELRANPAFLRGFDEAFQELEQRVARTNFPAIQAWQTESVCCTVSRQHGFPISVTFRVADLEGARQGEAEIAAWNPDCDRGQPFYRGNAATAGDLAARVAAARAVTEAQISAALTACPVAGVTVPSLMEGFDEAVSAAEARLAERQRRGQ